MKLNPSDLDYVSLSCGPDFEREVWSAANQFPLTPGANRMVLVRDADKLTRWSQLDAWLSRTRNLPGVYLVFVSDKPEQLTGKKGVPAHLAGLRAPRGFLVRAGGLSEDDAIAWVRRRSTLDTELAGYLLTRTGGNLAAAAAVCAKLALFEQGAGSATINALVAESPSADFTDHLIAGDKRKALLSLPDLDHTDRIRAVALLDSRLDLLQRLHRMKIAGQSWREASGISPFLLRLYMPHARSYDPDACTHRRQVLAVLDDVLRRGIDNGVMQALIALW
jgi:DNA polymerase III delta subunit